MREEYHRSFQFKNLCCGLFSLILAALTVLFFLFAIDGLSRLLSPKPKNQVTVEESTENKVTANSIAHLLENGSNTTLTGKTTGPTKDYNDLGAGFRITLGIIGGLIGLISFSTYFMLLTRQFGRSIDSINQGIKELSRGNFGLTIPIDGNDELTEIARNLNKMAVDIRNIMESERNTEYKKNELITNVAHDLRTPLTSILGYLEIVSTKQLSEEDRTRYIEIAYNKSKRLEKLIEDLFTYTKLEFGSVALHLGMVDIVKMMEQMLEEFYPSFYEYGLEYHFETTEKTIMIEADGALLARAFGNLIGNAIKYGKDGKNVNVHIDATASKVTISIINYGEIIPQSDIEKIFEKFYRVDSSRNEERGGTGLGLAIAKNIITMHNGQIGVRSNLDGTVFDIILNREEPNETED